MEARVAPCEEKLARLRVRLDGLEIGRTALLAEISTLETEVARLEAEDLQPLVDRLREQIRHILELLEEMSQEIAA